MKSYRFVNGQFEYVFEIKHSKFIATAIGEVDNDQAEKFVKEIKKKYSDATHNCYAYIADENGQATRFSDDGEPGGTAGQPILKVIVEKGLVKTAVVVTRYFGGIKLGAGGLVSAYAEAASKVLDNADIAEKFECVKISVKADYTTFAVVERYARKNDIVFADVNYGDGVDADIFVKCDEIEKTVDEINEISAGKCQITVSDQREFVI